MLGSARQQRDSFGASIIFLEQHERRVLNTALVRASWVSQDPSAALDHTYLQQRRPHLPAVLQDSATQVKWRPRASLLMSFPTPLPLAQHIAGGFLT